jgi:hypothetical protein
MAKHENFHSAKRYKVCTLYTRLLYLTSFRNSNKLNPRKTPKRQTLPVKIQTRSKCLLPSLPFLLPLQLIFSASQNGCFHTLRSPSNINNSFCFLKKHLLCIEVPKMAQLRKNLALTVLSSLLIG